MKLNSITLSGEVVGPIWEQSRECVKDFREVFTLNDRALTRRWSGMRDALLSVTNDGDFQSCSIRYCYCSVEYIHEADGEHNATTFTIKHSEIVACKAILDLYA